MMHVVKYTGLPGAMALSERMRIEGSVAQSVEQIPLKDAVVGSNPTGPTPHAPVAQLD